MRQSFFVTATANLFSGEKLDESNKEDPLLFGALCEFLLLKHLPSLLNLPAYKKRITNRWLQRMSTMALRYEMEAQATQNLHSKRLEEIVKRLSSLR